ncbi:uncharacterized protein LOC131858466 [Cryptomeria japonica]|uniref:uncharacterized protein LOC131858466 n=1 Tax=Cryptomeria japonica TaxID=3369 RepID=UPI0027DA8B03|nr:uncharacterized protein LOC131858466 [Cryptomeria japonica]
MGGVGWNRQCHTDFSAFVMDCGLFKIPFRTGDFTWTNRSGFFNIVERLDRFFIAGDWSESHWNCVAEILPITSSDHYPICLRIQDDSALDRCPFKFEAMWLRDSNITNLVECWWHYILEKSSNKAFIFFKKLQFLKEQFKKSNRESFSNIFSEKLGIEDELKIFHEQIINQGMDEEVFNKEKVLNKRYFEVLAREEIFWRQKSRKTWLKYGDRNTKFYHTSVKARKTQNKIFSIKNRDGVFVSDMNLINLEAVRHFSDIFNGEINPGGDLRQILEVIPSRVKEELNKMLMDLVSLEEVKKTIFGLGSDKSPGSDGFPALFLSKKLGHSCN